MKQPKYYYGDMNVGDTKMLQNANYFSVKAGASRFGKRKGRKFTVSKGHYSVVLQRLA